MRVSKVIKYNSIQFNKKRDSVPLTPQHFFKKKKTKKTKTIRTLLPMPTKPGDANQAHHHTHTHTGTHKLFQPQVAKSKPNPPTKPPTTAIHLQISLYNSKKRQIVAKSNQISQTPFFSSLAALPRWYYYYYYY